VLASGRGEKINGGVGGNCYLKVRVKFSDLIKNKQLVKLWQRFF
jgi:hypothetical protein